MDETYVVAQNRSYQGQESTFTFPDKEGISVVPLGFQPVGISILGSTIAVADYFGPSIMLAEVSLQHGVPYLGDIRWIRSTIAGGKRVRMFPDLYQPGGANRMQSVLMFSQTLLGLTRNEDNKVFPIRLRSDGEWEHEDVFSYPRVVGIDAITSAVLTNDGLVTIEVNLKKDAHTIRDYRGSGLRETATVPYRYGIAVRSDGTVVTVADYRAEEHGLFFGDEVKVRGLVGNGVVLLNDGEGGALVTRYGQGHPGPFNGVPGALIFVPPEFLK